MEIASQLIPVTAYLDALKSLTNVPYIWGGKSPHGLDCSGTVTYALWLASGTLRQEPLPDLREDWNAARLYLHAKKAALDAAVQDALKASDGIQGASDGRMRPIDYCEGALAFYGPPGHPNHVMSLMVNQLSNQLQPYGACGAGSQCTTAQYALAHGAKVQFRNTVAYRPDFLGVYRLPFIDYSNQPSSGVPDTH